MKLKIIIPIILVSVVLFSCKKNTAHLPVPDPSMAELKIPADFDFETTKTILLTINDASNTSYDVYSITTSDDG